MFSSRLAPDLSPGRLQQALDRLRAEGAPLLDLTRANPPQCGLGPEASQLARALTAPSVAEYHPDPRGLLSTRQAVAAYYDERGLPTQPEQIFLGASTSQAYAELIKLFADPGDEILVPQPSYPLFDMLVALEGCRPVPLPSVCAPDGHWRVDRSALERAFSARTRAVILVSPNNPTGVYLTTDEQADVQRLCAEHECPLLLDEVFYDYAAEGFTVPPRRRRNGRADRAAERAVQSRWRAADQAGLDAARRRGDPRAPGGGASRVHRRRLSLRLHTGPAGGRGALA